MSIYDTTDRQLSRGNNQQCQIIYLKKSGSVAAVLKHMLCYKHKSWDVTNGCSTIFDHNTWVSGPAALSPCLSYLRLDFVPRSVRVWYRPPAGCAEGVSCSRIFLFTICSQWSSSTDPAFLNNLFSLLVTLALRLLLQQTTAKNIKVEYMHKIWLKVQK